MTSKRAAILAVAAWLAAPVSAGAECAPDWTFHLDRLQANNSLKVMKLDSAGIANIQRYLDITMQTPLKVSRIPDAEVYAAWQYMNAPPAIGVIDIVEGNCVLYRHQDFAQQIVDIISGHWSH